MSVTNLKRRSDNADVVDLTREDENVINLVEDDIIDEKSAAIARRKLRKSEKQRRQLEEFQEYLQELSEEDRKSVSEAFSRVSEEKRELLRRREEFRSSNRPGPQSDKIKTQLDSTLLALVGMEDKIRRGDTMPAEAESYGVRAGRIGDGVRRLIYEFSTNDAIARIAENIHHTEREMLQNNTWFNEGRRHSMITPTAVSTGSNYRPLYLDDNANQEVIRGALENSAHPGLLPDGSYVPSEIVQKYRSNEQNRSRQSGVAAATQIYQQTEFMHHPNSAIDTRAFEALVDQALNEAEPLDFPPQMLCATLEHQRQGLGWLIRAERGNNKGGILADDMGLGKTVQTIALFYANPPPLTPESQALIKPSASSDMSLSPHNTSTFPSQEPESVVTGKPNDYRLILVVCPVALIRTWEDELKARVRPESRMRVYVHHSSNKKRLKSSRRIQEVADVVICSYHALVTEYRELETFRTTRAQLESEGDHSRALRLHLDTRKTPLLSIKWHRVVLDEAHLIKNKHSQMSLAATELKAKYRLVLTGTPMQNRLEELYPLIRFLHIEPHCNWTQFQQLLPKNDNLKQFEGQKNLAAFLSAVLLRRKKDTMINGRKIIDNLPPKHIVCQKSTMVEGERKSYDQLEQKIKDEFEKKSKSEKPQRNFSRIEETMQWSNMLVYLLRLRQTACHPLLVQITKSSQQRAHWGKNDETKEMCKIALRVDPTKRQAILQIPDNNRVCYQCNGPASVLVDTNMLTNCGHIACSECSPTLIDNEEGGACLCGARSRHLANLEILSVIEKERPASVAECLEVLLRYQFPRLESQKRDAEQRRRRLNELQEDARQRITLDDWADDEYPFDLSDPEDNYAEDLVESPLPSNEDQISDLTNDLFVDSGQSPEAQSYHRDSNDSSELEIIEEVTPVTVQDTVTRKSQKPSRKDPLAPKIDIDDVARNFKIAGIFENGWATSAKVESCLQILRDIWTTSPDDKVIIFSSFTSFIDVLAIPLIAAMIPHEEYTGRMNVNDRNEVLEKFKTGRTKVLLTSLKAGNVGLTLTQANRVILIEPFWNPYIEDQAQDRVYRIGQSREVTVYRLFVTDTVEDRISALQDKKRELIESALENGGKTKSQNLSRADIMYALGLR